MSQFQLDTSGLVTGKTPLGDAWEMGWSDLSPFAQGYVEALFNDYHGGTYRGFQDLAPETLAAILKDCAKMEERRPSWSAVRTGADFWKFRQDRVLPLFPPLTVSLNEDGKVRTQAAADTSDAQLGPGRTT